MHLHLHIDRLILHDLPLEDQDRDQVQIAIEAELVRLLSTGAFQVPFATDAHYANVRAGSIQLADRDGSALGVHIAGAIYGSIGEIGGHYGETRDNT